MVESTQFYSDYFITEVLYLPQTNSKSFNVFLASLELPFVLRLLFGGVGLFVLGCGLIVWPLLKKGGKPTHALSL